MLRPQISDDLIRQLIPNIQRTVNQETTWSSRLAPFISNATDTLERSISPLDTIPGTLGDTATAFIITRAWAQAIPALDLVATPNGFAVDSNQTLAPASAARVAEARAAAISRSSSLACTLIRNLHSDFRWRQTPQWAIYRSIFPVPDIYADARRAIRPDTSGITARQSDFSIWLSDRAAIIGAEEYIAHCLIGTAALNRARDIAAEVVRNGKPSTEDLEVISILRGLVIRTASGTPPASLLSPGSSNLLRVLDTGLSGTDIAAAWRTSQQYRAFKATPFRNKKSSPGYFF